MRDIQKLRISLNMSQQEFADFLDLEQGTISSWEVGKVDVKPIVMDGIKWRVENMKKPRRKP